MLILEMIFTSYDPWEKLSLATSIPSIIIFFRVSTSLEAGPESEIKCTHLYTNINFFIYPTFRATIPKVGSTALLAKERARLSIERDVVVVKGGDNRVLKSSKGCKQKRKRVKFYL